MKNYLVNTEVVRNQNDRKSLNNSIIGFILLCSLIIFAGSCKKDDMLEMDNITNEQILSMPPVQFVPEKVATLDSSSSSQDREYNYKIDYYSVAAGYDEQIVLNPQTDVIYPGALIKGETILDGSYVTIPVERKPIVISTSLQGSDKVSIEVENPKLSTVREAVNTLLNQNYNVPPANLGFTVERIYNREQLNLALRASYQSGIMDINSSFNYSNTKIQSRVVAKFIQNYYTLDMDPPSSPADLIGELPAGNPFGSLMPMYISTVTFGRMALFTVESELSATEVESYLQASYSQVDADASVEFEKLRAKSTMKVYVLGGSGEAAGKTINGFNDFKNYIIEGGSFSEESPGAPISYKLRYIHDNTIAKVVFAASYPVRTAIPRTDNLRYDISVRLYKFQPGFEDGDGSANEFYGNVSSYLNNNSGSSKSHWKISSGGNYLKISKNKTHTFTNNTTTNRSYSNLKDSDYITISMHIKEKDSWPDADEDLGSSKYKINLVDVIATAPANYTYKITNYGQGSSFMNIQFIVTITNIKHI